MNTQLSSGRPLAALMIGVAGYPLSRHGHAEILTRRASAAAHTVFNNLGAPRQLHRLPWIAGPEDRICSFITPIASPEHITATMAVLGGTLHLTASFHSNVFDKTLVHQALKHFATDPIATVLGDPAE